MSGTFQGRVAFASIRYTGAVPAIVAQSGDFGNFDLTILVKPSN